MQQVKTKKPAIKTNFSGFNAMCESFVKLTINSEAIRMVNVVGRNWLRSEKNKIKSSRTSLYKSKSPLAYAQELNTVS